MRVRIRVRVRVRVGQHLGHRRIEAHLTATRLDVIGHRRTEALGLVAWPGSVVRVSGQGQWSGSVVRGREG